MPLIRPTVLRSVQSSLRHSTARATARTAPSRTQLVARRYASSGGHEGGHGEASSDLPWMLGALAITPPACWYLWPEPHAEHHGEHGEHGDHDDHAEAEDSEEKQGEEGQSEEDEAPQEDSAPAEQADKPEKGDEAEDKSEEKSGDDSQDQDKGDDSDNSQGESEAAEKKADAEQTKGGSDNQDSKVEGVQFKGKMKEDSAGRNDERKSESRPQNNSSVRRIDSGLGKKLGEGSTYSDEDPKKESQATSKEAGSSPGDISQKQKGLSTTDTKHSIQIDQRDDKSTKGSGEPETAKAKGTVDPAGPITGGPGKN